jgi:hypothetical protein
MATQVVPEVLHRIQFRRVRRQRQDRHVRGNLQVVGTVKARLVPDQHHMYGRIGFRDKLLQEPVDHRRVQLRAQQAHALAGLRADRPQYPQPVILGLLDRRRPGAAAGPFAGQSALLAEASLVLEPDLDLLAGVLLGNLLDLLQGVFLIVSWAAGSAL